MSINIKPENRGKFNATKKRTGKTTEELTHSKNPLTRKRAIFAQNSKKWAKKEEGGTILTPEQILPFNTYTNYDSPVQIFPEGGNVTSSSYEDYISDLQKYRDSLTLHNLSKEEIENYTRRSADRWINSPYGIIPSSQYPFLWEYYYGNPTIQQLSYSTGIKPSGSFRVEGNIPYFKKPLKPKEPITSLATLQTQVQSQSPIEVQLPAARQYTPTPKNYTAAFPGSPNYKSDTVSFSTEEELKEFLQDIQQDAGVTPKRQRYSSTDGGATFDATWKTIEENMKAKGKFQYGGKAYAEQGYPYNLTVYNPIDENGQLQTLDPFANLGDGSNNSTENNSGFKQFSQQKPMIDLGIKGESAKRPNSLQNMKGLEEAGKIPEGTVAQTKTNIAGSVFNAAGTAMQSLAPPDSKFGKAMEKGNAFAQAAEPLGMLDMVVPGLGTGLVQGARLVGAITGGIQAKNEEIDQNRIEDTTNFLRKYNNMNFTPISQGSTLAREGTNVQANHSSLIEEIFTDFDILLEGTNTEEKLKATDGVTIDESFDPTLVAGTSYAPPNIRGIQGKTPEEVEKITNYMDFTIDELYSLQDTDAPKEMLPLKNNKPKNLNTALYRRLPNSSQYVPLSAKQYPKGLEVLSKY